MEILEKIYSPVETEEGICKYDGETRLRSGNKDIFCEACRDRYQESLVEVGYLKELMVGDSGFTAQFKDFEDVIDYVVFESLVRLASPSTHEVYDSLHKLHLAIGWGRRAVDASLQRLVQQGKIIAYPTVNRKTDKFGALLRVLDIEPERKIRQPVLKRAEKNNRTSPLGIVRLEP